VPKEFPGLAVLVCESLYLTFMMTRPWRTV
jgi:hypothetical protein